MTTLCTAMHGMQTLSSDENSICLLSVCLSNACIYCDKTEERAVKIFYHTKDHLN